MSIPGARPCRPVGGHDEEFLDLIFSARDIPPGAPSELRPLERLIADLTGPADADELAGEAMARAIFSRAVPPVGPPSRDYRAESPQRSLRARLSLVAALVVVAAGLGSAAAAYVGTLPSPIQHLAHVAIGAPPPPNDCPGRPLVVGSSSSAGQSPVSHPRRTLRVLPVTATPDPSRPSEWSWRSSAPRDLQRRG
jgi:hypothetical protein